MNLATLHRANELRREAIISGDDPILHKAADVEISRLVNENNDRLLLLRAQARAVAKVTCDPSLVARGGMDAARCIMADALRAAGRDDEASDVLKGRFEDV